MKLLNDSTIAMMMTSALMLGVAGCNGETSTPNATNTNNLEHADDHDDEHGGEHASHGPHGGDLIELGEDESYHAELVHADNDDIVIYILGSDAKTAAPIDATEIVVNVVHDGNPEQFKLAASPDEGDPEGQSSRFSSSDAELSEHVHEEAAQAKLVVTIDGKQFKGNIAHDHDADHGHSHE
jgi:hypothetical protein